MKRRKVTYPNPEWKQTPEMNERAVKLYNFIMVFYAQHGYSPSIREIMPILQVSSTSLAAYTLNILINWRWIERGEKGGRNIRLMRPTERGLSAENLRTLLWLPALPEKATLAKVRTRKTPAFKKRAQTIGKQIKSFKA
jgi:SOS-response transcriptional repressor LexA